MDFTTIRVSEEVADELARRKGRGDSYDDVLREVLKMEATDELPPTSGDVPARSAASAREALADADDGDGDDGDLPTVSLETEAEIDWMAKGRQRFERRVERAIEAVTGEWDDDHRFENRRMAAESVLRHAIDTGEAVGESSDIVDTVRETYPVDGQDEDTYWRQNIRPLLAHAGEYSDADGGYRVTSDTLPGDE